LNVGSGETRSVIDVIEAIEAITGSTLQREFVPSRNTDVKIANLDISLARQELGWAPKTPFLKGIERTIRSAYAPGHHGARNSLS
jgi:UDP-glucose 4-epimerase